MSLIWLLLVVVVAAIVAWIVDIVLLALLPAGHHIPLIVGIVAALVFIGIIYAAWERGGPWRGGRPVV